ncbi:MAG: helix-turn-helix domain-containing protein [Gammaproteobacteria bacterium]
MKEWVSQADAARLRGVSRQAISKLVQKGRLRTLTIGGHVLVHRDDVIGKRTESDTHGESDIVSGIKEILAKASSQDRSAVFEWLRDTQKIHPLEEEFGAKAEIILEAISRSSDLTKRGVRGVIAEAVFKVEVIDKLDNWHDVTPDGDYSYDFLLSDGDHEVSIQLKMQRLKARRPMTAKEGYKILDPSYWVVETQRTRGGRTSTGQDTRPYKFGDFDLLAVSMHPSTGRWTDFLFTVSDWLIERPDNSHQILKFQPVPKYKNDDWTDNLIEAIKWSISHTKKKIAGTLGIT